MNWSQLSIPEIKAYVEQLREVPPSLVDELLRDGRKGTAELARRLNLRLERERKQAEKWAELTRVERSLRERGKRTIIGVDEVGRGPLAGPVVACAVALPEDFFLPGLDDSKKLAPAVREALYEVILRDAVAVGVGVVSAERIDEINILEATREAMRLAVEDAGLTPEVCLIDAVHVPGLPGEQIPIIGGDGKSASIAAASVVAKVTRDRLMAEYASLYPAYGFEKNAGYGTEEHLDALRRFGPCPIHRRTFGGVKEILHSSKEGG